MLHEVVTGRPIIQRKDTCGGAPIIQGTRIRVSDVAIEYEHFRKSPEEIVAAFPTLSLPDVFSALKYYYENKEAIQKEIQNDDLEFAQAKAAQHVRPTM